MKIAAIVLAVLIVVGAAAFWAMASAAEKGLDSLTYEDADISNVADGTYVGEADAGLVFARVSVTVKAHRIVDIEILEHKNGRGGKAESIVDTMVEQNSYQVDAVSGATLSSEAIKSAASKALKAGCPG